MWTVRTVALVAGGVSAPVVRANSRPPTVSTVHKVFAGAGERAELPFPVYPHMLRGCGFRFANDDQDPRTIQHGHRNIRHAVRYTENGGRPVQGVLGVLESLLQHS